MPRTLPDPARVRMARWPILRPALLLTLAVLTVLPLLVSPVGTAAAGPAAERSVTAEESLGGLRIGAPASAVERLLGRPESKGDAELWGADGLYHRDWTYPKAGAVIGMSAPKAAGPWTVASLTLEAPATLKTAHGVGIGSTRREVQAAYGRAAHRGDEGSVVVGSEFDGLIFNFDRQGRVERVFLGAAAE